MLDHELIDVNAASENGRTATYEASRYGHLVIVKMLGQIFKFVLVQFRYQWVWRTTSNYTFYSYVIDDIYFTASDFLPVIILVHADSVEMH